MCVCVKEYFSQTDHCKYTHALAVTFLSDSNLSMNQSKHIVIQILTLIMPRVIASCSKYSWLFSTFLPYFVCCRFFRQSPDIVVGWCALCGDWFAAVVLSVWSRHACFTSTQGETTTGTGDIIAISS